MKHHALQLMQIIDSYEQRHCPDFNPRPALIRLNPAFSDALDFLLDSGYVKVIWNTGPPGSSSNADIFDSDSDILVLTERGRKILTAVLEFLGSDLAASVYPLKAVSGF